MNNENLHTCSFADVMEMSINEVKKTGKSKAVHFIEQGKYCDLGILLAEYDDCYSKCWSSSRSIVMFNDGSAIEVKSGAFRII